MSFITDDFILSNETAKTLYHKYAKHLPIVDYHCHLDPKEIYEDVRFENITQVWLAGDHYKWRIMRSNGVAEEYITGSASDREVPEVRGSSAQGHRQPYVPLVPSGAEDLFRLRRYPERQHRPGSLGSGHRKTR